MSLPQELLDMSPADRPGYFKGHPITTASQGFANGKDPVGSVRVERLYQARCREVGVGPWCDTEEEARKEGESFLNNWNGELP